MDTGLRDFDSEWEPYYVIFETLSFIFFVVFTVSAETEKERANKPSKDICMNHGHYLIGMV